VAPGVLPALVVALSGVAAVGSVALVTALLATERGRANALGYQFGYLGAYAAIGLAVVGADANVAAWTSGEAGRAGPILVTLLGAVFVVLGLRTALRGRRTSEPLDVARRPGLLDRATPGRSFALGVMVALVNVKNLALFLTAIAVLQASDLTAGQRLAAVPLVATTFCLGVFVPLAIDLAAPARSARLLAGLRRGIDRQGRLLATWLPIVVGLVFVARGVRGLVA